MTTLSAEALRQFEQLLAPLTTKIDNLETKVDCLTEKLDKIFGTDADDLAKKVTVAIQAASDTADSGSIPVYFHGLLLRLDGVAGTTQPKQPRFYHLLSAAHVLVEHCAPGAEIVLTWSGSGRATTAKFRVQQLYLDGRYILDGSRDIGVAAVEPIGDTTNNFDERVVHCGSPPGDDKVGQVAIGHGLVYLGGRLVLEQIDGTPRAMMMDAMSVPGCSGGCPIFTHRRIHHRPLGSQHRCSLWFSPWAFEASPLP